MLRDRTVGGTWHCAMHKFYSMLYIYYAEVTILTHSISYSSPLCNWETILNFLFHIWWQKYKTISKNFMFSLIILSCRLPFCTNIMRESLGFNLLLKFRIQCLVWIVSHFQSIFKRCLNCKEDNIFKEKWHEVEKNKIWN